MARLAEAPRYKAVGCGSVFIDLILLATLWPRVDSAFNRNEYLGCLLGGKDGQCVVLTALTPSCACCIEILGTSACWSCQGMHRPVYRYTFMLGILHRANPRMYNSLPTSISTLNYMPDFHKIWCGCYGSVCHPECHTIYCSAVSN